MYRVWYSTESFADYIIDNTTLISRHVVKNRMYESDANQPKKFYTMPDHIRKILYLDAPDLIVEKDNEPIFSIEVTTEAGTGHNAFQRFARIAAAVENSVPAFYIYPEGAIISRSVGSTKWDTINPLIFSALESMMSVYDIPALLYYFPSDIDHYYERPEESPNLLNKGLKFDANIVDYAGCPDSTAVSMQNMFSAIDIIIENTETRGVLEGRERLLRDITIRNQRNFMQSEYYSKANGRMTMDMSPLSAVSVVDTDKLIQYLSRYENRNYELGELLKSRPQTALYQVNAKFRGDPYPGALAAIDYMICRNGKTYEDREKNLVLVFGKITQLDDGSIEIVDEKGSTISDFFDAVKSCMDKSLLGKDYADLSSKDIPRYMMQVRYGSTYSKVKHIRVFSYFADAILFPDGSLWRDA